MLNTDFHFLRPYWLLAIIPLLIIVYLLILSRYRNNSWEKICDANLLPHLLTVIGPSKQYWIFAALALGWLLTSFALAGPTWSHLPQPVYSTLEGKVIALDLSANMLATDIPPDRISRTRYKLLDLLNALPSGRIGMVAFTNEAYTVSPLTDDIKTVANLIPALAPDIMPVPGSNISAGLEQSVKLLQQAGLNQGAIILVTANTPNAKDFETISKLYRKGFIISVFGIGTQQGAPIPDRYHGFATTKDGTTIISKLNIAALNKFAAAGGGEFTYFTNDNQDINALLKTSISEKLNQKTKQQAEVLLWKDQGSWFILLILPLVLLAFRRGWLEELN